MGRRRKHPIDPLAEGEQAKALAELTGPLSVALEPAVPEDVEAVRQQLANAPRDLVGIIEGESPHLAERQVIWVLTRAMTLTDEEACASTNIDKADVGRWRADPAFEAILQESIANKREATRLLGTQLLPKVMHRLYRVLDGSSDRNAIGAAKLFLQTQGLLIDRTHNTNENATADLMAKLREPMPVEAAVFDVKHRGIPSPDTLDDDL